jgi:gamma-glutamyltranspeptidase/glutathione hydrolase
MQILKVLELSEPAALAPGAATRPDFVIEALAIGHTSSRKNPIRDMTNPEREIAERTSPATASKLRGDARDRNPGETTHYSLVDGDGMAVAVTASINNYFGALVASPKLGFFYNDYLTDMIVGDPSHPFALRGDAPPYSSMGATILAREGRPHFAAGSPGSARIISAVSQVAQLWADGQRDIAGAVAEPRWHVIPPDRLYAEDMNAVPAWRARLEQRGWNIRGAPADMEPLGLRGRNAYFGGVHAVALENGRWTGAADPRRDGMVTISK